MASAEQWPDHIRHEQMLVEIERQLASRPQDSDLRCDQAQVLTQLGRLDEARALYLQILAAAPSHFRALNNLGNLLHDTGYRTAARTAYAEAIARHPDQPIAYINLANILRESGEEQEALAHYARALELKPGSAEAHRGLAYIFRNRGEDEKARAHERTAFEGQGPTILPYRGSGRPIRAIMLISARGGNLPIQNLLDPQIFHVVVLVAEFVDPHAPLPSHDLFVNAIGDADLCGEGLEIAQHLVGKSQARIINQPAAVLATGRTDNARRFGAHAGVIAPRVARLARAQMIGADGPALLARHDLRFPVLLRAPGFHAGQHFVKVEEEGQLAAAAGALPGTELIAIQFLDARSADGKIRKYRIMMIGGKLYPLHAAVSSHWKIHYFSAEMADRPEHRAEDAAFLNDFAAVLGPRAVANLVAIKDAIALDYAGIDFSLNRDGDILLYEVNANMIVPPPEADPRWDYRRPAVMHVHQAISDLLTGLPRA